MNNIKQNSFPREWKPYKLQELFSFKNGVNSDKDSYGKGIKFINIMEVIDKDYLHYNDIPGFITLEEKAIKSNLVQHGDILFNRTSETPEEIGLSSVYLDKEPVIFGGFVIKGNPSNDYTEIEYRKYFLSASYTRRQIIQRGQGAVRSNIGQKDLDKVIVYLPPKAEQKAIAHILSTWDFIFQYIFWIVSIFINIPNI